MATASAPLPVNPDVMIWARERAGLSVEDAAAKAKVTPDRLVKWETSQASPTPRQARLLARVYGRPFLEFFAKERPNLIAHMGSANPFRPGAGQLPPVLAGRKAETEAFLALLAQGRMLDNLVLSGLWGIGKTALLAKFRQLAIERRWRWIGSDLSEQVNLNEDRLSHRLCADLSLVLAANAPPRSEAAPGMNLGTRGNGQERPPNFQDLMAIHSSTPGLSVDKVKAVLETAWEALAGSGTVRGIVFAYDGAQNLLDHRARDEFPAAVLLDAFQSLQRKGLPLMLVFAGHPMLPWNLVEVRDYAERMFRTVVLDRLAPQDSRDAIIEPLAASESEFQFRTEVVEKIVELSGGYPYFIQYICREVYDLHIGYIQNGGMPSVPVHEIEQKLDMDFFAGRWQRATDRQRELMTIIAQLAGSDEEFSVRDIVEQSRKELSKPFSGSHVNQMLGALAQKGFVFRNRHGKYSFAVPLLGRFIRRQELTD